MLSCCVCEFGVGVCVWVGVVGVWFVGVLCFLCLDGGWGGWVVGGLGGVWGRGVGEWMGVGVWVVESCMM